ncbi:MAG: deoxynucleoside kinase [Nanoarchaeota archaeon]|nr:deoxynucleoside kinase [Nanoarchaeota archaeon]
MDGYSGKKFVCASGNIGVGKTTATDLLVEMLGLKKKEETWQDNPYMQQFYKAGTAKGELNPWAYRVQRNMLFRRVLDHDDINMATEDTIQDRSLYEDMLFAENQFRMGLWTPEEYGKYSAFAALLHPELRSPDAIIYLWASVPTLKERIKGRLEEPGRGGEVDLLKPGNTYLESLQSIYNTWFKEYRLGPKIRVDTEVLNVRDIEEDRQTLVTAVQAMLAGDAHVIDGLVGVENGR